MNVSKKASETKQGASPENANIPPIDVTSFSLSELPPPHRDLHVTHIGISLLIFLLSFYFLLRLYAWLSLLGRPYRMQAPSNYFDLMIHALEKPPVFFVIAVCAAAAAAWSIYFLSSGKQKRQRYQVKLSDTGIYGTSRYMNWNEIKDSFTICPLDKPEGIVLGVRNKKAICLPRQAKDFDHDFNKNILISGPPGTRKSRSVIIPAILDNLDAGNSIVVADSKGDLYIKTAPVALKKGYKVRIFNARSNQFRYSDGLDCLKQIRCSSDPLSAAFTFADIVISNTQNPKINNQEFWINMEKNLLAALSLYVARSKSWTPQNPGGKRDLREVYALVNLDLATLSTRFDEAKLVDPQDLSLVAFNRFRNNSQATQALSNLGIRLYMLQDPYISGMLSEDEIDLRAPGEERCIYYVIMDDQISTYSFISSLYFSFQVYELVNMADEGDQELKIPVAFILDEFLNIGQIPDFTKKISTNRSRGISYIICIHGLNQFALVYPNGEWENILNCCDTRIILGANENTTSTYFSDMSGDATVEIQSKMRQIPTFSPIRIGDETRYSITYAQRKLLLPDEIEKMPIYMQLVFTKGGQVLEEYKYDFTHHPLSNVHAYDSRTGKKVTLKPTKHTPRWVQSRFSETEGAPVEKEPPAKPSAQSDRKLPKGRRTQVSNNVPVFSKEEEPFDRTQPEVEEEPYVPFMASVSDLPPAEEAHPQMVFDDAPGRSRSSGLDEILNQARVEQKDLQDLKQHQKRLENRELNEGKVEQIVGSTNTCSLEDVLVEEGFLDTFLQSNPSQVPLTDSQPSSPQVNLDSPPSTYSASSEHDNHGE